MSPHATLTAVKLTVFPFSEQIGCKPDAGWHNGNGSFQVHGVESAIVLSRLWVLANTALTRPLEIDFQPTQHRLSRCWVGFWVGVEFWRHNFKQLFKIYVSWFKFLISTDSVSKWIKKHKLLTNLHLLNLKWVNY